jgi:hypothetical protein
VTAAPMVASVAATPVAAASADAHMAYSLVAAVLVDTDSVTAAFLEAAP